MNNLFITHYVIDTLRNEYGLFELWESRKYGDLDACVVTLNRNIVGTTFETLTEFIENEY